MIHKCRQLVSRHADIMPATGKNPWWEGTMGSMDLGGMNRKRVIAENGEMGSLHALLERYPDERSCERRVIEVRWPEGRI